ncbi:MAG: DUF6442 family protein [Syntrophomonadaceae bacterium]|nr:DUF6442 family protein [Syntrophomonadaceae bacterium]
MKMIDYIVAIIGVLLLGTGLFLLWQYAGAQGVMLALPYVCIGVGCGTFGHGMGNVISRRALKKSPTLQKQIEIEKNDERNRALSNQAKGKAYDLMIFVFGALMISFALMGVEVVPLLLLVFAYLFVVGCGVYYRYKYDKEM